MKPLMFDAAAASVPAFSFFGMDGHFAIGNQNNALRALTGQMRSNSFLPLGVQASFTLMKRKPDIEAGIERADVNDTRFFSHLADAIQAPGTHPALAVTIKSVTLTYESVLLKDQGDVARISRSPLRYYFDYVIMRCNTLASGVLHDHQKIQLPRHTMFVYLIFQLESHFIPAGRANAYLSNRFKFPPNLDEIHLNLTGKEGLVFQRGFKGVSQAAGRHSTSMRLYVSELIKQGLYTKTFDDFFPVPHADTHAFDQAILLDLTPYQDELKEMGSLEVILKYSAASVTKWYLRTFGIVPACHQYSPTNLWTMQFL